MLASVRAPPATVRPRVPPESLLLSARTPPKVAGVAVVADAENGQAGPVVHDHGLGSDAGLRQAVDRHVVAVEVQHGRLGAAAEDEVSVPAP